MVPKHNGIDNSRARESRRPLLEGSPRATDQPGVSFVGTLSANMAVDCEWNGNNSMRSLDGPFVQPRSLRTIIQAGHSQIPTSRQRPIMSVMFLSRLKMGLFYRVDEIRHEPD